MYLVRLPYIIRKLFPSVTWDLRTEDPILYLTFDDGPIPEVTPWVLDLLKQYDAKATFFCVGENVERNPALFERLIAEGHSVGNHTYSHLNGWKTPTSLYLDNIRRCSAIRSNLFRPPYGRMKMSQYRKLLAEGFRVVMWDVLSADFDKAVTGQKCVENVLTHARSGSVIVFHDSLKASERLFYSLPRVLEHYSLQKYSFRAIPLSERL